MAEEASTIVGPVGATETQMSLQDKAASNIVSITVAGNRVGNCSTNKSQTGFTSKSASTWTFRDC